MSGSIATRGRHKSANQAINLYGKINEYLPFCGTAKVGQ